MVQTGRVPLSTHRYLAATIADDAIASGKMAFVSGPRQVGKTTLAKDLLTSPQNYQTRRCRIARRPQ